jgi:hypothetical protein
MDSYFAALPRQYSIMIYGEHPVAFEASCQVFVCGDRGIMHSITGARFYDHWMQPGEVDKLLAACGVKSLEGYAVEAHARLMARSLRKVAKVSFGASGKMAGRSMIWCTVESLDS